MYIIDDDMLNAAYCMLKTASIVKCILAHWDLKTKTENGPSQNIGFFSLIMIYM